MFDLMRRNNNQMNSYNPFKEMEDFEKNFFGNAFDNFFTTKDLSEFKTDIIDEGDHYLLEADLPGFDKKDIDINITENALTIKASRHSKVEEREEKNKIVHIERSYGSYMRQFDVSEIDTENIKAKYSDGVLKLELPKKAKVLPASKKLEIE